MWGLLYCHDEVCDPFFLGLLWGEYDPRCRVCLSNGYLAGGGTLLSLPLNSAGAPHPHLLPAAIAIPFQDLFVSAATKASTMEARDAAPKVTEMRHLISVRMGTVTLLKILDRKVPSNHLY